MLVALPDVDVESGSRPTFTDRQVTETVESLVEDGLGRVRRAMVVKARTALVRSALAHVPPRRIPTSWLRRTTCDPGATRPQAVGSAAPTFPDS